jgi:hypothetical protein
VARVGFPSVHGSNSRWRQNVFSWRCLAKSKNMMAEWGEKDEHYHAVAKKEGSLNKVGASHRRRRVATGRARGERLGRLRC